MNGYSGLGSTNSSTEYLRTAGNDIDADHESFMMATGIASPEVAAKMMHSVHSLALSTPSQSCKHVPLPRGKALIFALIGRHRKALVLGSSIVFSILVSLYNSFVFNKQHYNVGLPIFAAVIYDTTQYVLAAIILLIRERHAGFPSLLAVYRQCSARRYAKFVVPCGLAAALNVALSNCSLQLISLSFYTMVKSSSLMFLLLFAFLFRLEQPTQHLLGIIGIVGAGLVLMLYHPVSFSMTGFILVFGSAIFSGLRWSLTQVILQRYEEKSHSDETSEGEKLAGAMAGAGPLRTILFLGPIIIPCLFSLSLLVEGPQSIINSVFFTSPTSAQQAWGICIFGGLQCFLVIGLEYQCVRETSVLTLSIASIIKEVAIIGISVIILGDRIPLVNVIGAVIVIIGIFLYSLYKMNRSQQREHEASPSESSSFGRRRRRHSYSHHLEETALQSLYISESPWILDPLYSASSDTLGSSQLLIPPPVAASIRDTSIAEDLFHPHPPTTVSVKEENQDGLGSIHSASPVLRTPQVN